MNAPDLILHNGAITTLAAAHPQVSAVAIAGGRITASGGEELLATAGDETKRIDLKGRRVIPGLNDSHIHVIRGGLNFNMELRWDGVPSLADALAMLKAQARRTPPPQWVRVIGGWSEFQSRVSSYNPWVALSWLVTGRTVGGLRLYPEANRLGREEALRLYTVGSSWFSSEEGKKGQIAPGQLADLAVLSADYFTVPEEEIRGIEAVLTMVGGRVVYGAEEFGGLAPPPLPVSPDWSPVAGYGGYQRGAAGPMAIHKGCACHGHRQVWSPKESRLWGIGCDCFAF